MTSPIKIYEEIAKATNNTELARIIAEAFDEAENRYPLQDMATKSHVTERTLELQKEIESVRLEIKEVEGKLRKEIESVRLELTKEIESVRLEIKEVEGKLRKEIESVRLEIKEVEARFTKEIASQSNKTIMILGGYITIIAALFKLFGA